MMGSIHDGFCVSSIIPYCGWMLGLVRNSREIASSRFALLVEASFTNASAYEFLLHGMTSMETAENKLSFSFAWCK